MADTELPQRIAVEESKTHPQVGLIDFVLPFLVVLWKEWPKDMELSSCTPEALVLSGTCPHCGKEAALFSVTKPFEERHPTGPSRIIAALKCIACDGYILGIARFVPSSGYRAFSPVYETHYPLGKPQQIMNQDVPTLIRACFNEALRCRWTESVGATVLMCRRALQVSCDIENATGNDLYSQIDDLAKKGRITEPLRAMAHRIRLLGKRGAHGDYSDIDDTVTLQDADDAIMFMQHYVDHVYVLPARLKPTQP
jgi:hypothetical protein